MIAALVLAFQLRQQPLPPAQPIIFYAVGYDALHGTRYLRRMRLYVDDAEGIEGLPPPPADLKVRSVQIVINGVSTTGELCDPAAPVFFEENTILWRAVYVCPP